MEKITYYCDNCKKEMKKCDLIIATIGAHFSGTFITDPIYPMVDEYVIVIQGKQYCGPDCLIDVIKKTDFSG